MRGFSLLELLIVLTIICLLLTLAYPAYQHHIVQARRNEAKIGLLQLASKLENYASLNNQYSGATLSDLGMPATTDDNSYQFSILDLSDSHYTITAIPQGPQASADTACASLLLDDLGTKSITGTRSITTCW